MAYTYCAYWKNATTLDEVKEQNSILIAQKMKLEKGMRVLRILVVDGEVLQNTSRKSME